MGGRTEQMRPMRDLLARLPLLPLSASQEVDHGAADPALLVAIAEDAEMLMGAMHQGVGSIGQLLAHSAVMIEDGSIGAEALEALGFMMAELGDLASSCMVLAALCRRETADYIPQDKSRIFKPAAARR